MQDFDYEQYIWGSAATIINLKQKRHSTLGLRRFLDIVQPEGAQVLEIGCGTGIFLRSLKKYRPDLELFGCDISHRAIIIARENKQYAIQYEICDALSLPYGDESFDMVVMMDVLEHLTDVEKAVEEARRVLKKEGIFHLFIPCEANFFSLYWFMWKLRMGGNLKRKYAGHIQRFTTNNVCSLLRNCGFSIVKQSFSFHGLGQIYDVFFDYIPRLFQKKSVVVTQKQETLSAIATLLRSFKQRGVFLSLWLAAGRLVEILAYYESVALKNFTAPGLHVTCRKGGVQCE